MAQAPSQTRTDKRYRSARWLKLRKWILQRDLFRCWVVDCPYGATCVDHIEPVYVGMSDALFYDPQNLRASCKRHNTARGVAARLARETGDALGRGAIMPRPQRPRWATVSWGRR